MIMDEHNININDDKIWRLSEVTGEYLPGDRYGHGAVTLENGQILVIGGKTRYKERMEVFLLDVENQSNLNNELSISVATKFLMPFEGRWGFACAYYAKERLLFLHGGFSATHNYGQTVLFQMNSHSMAPVPVLVSNIQGPSPRGYHSAALSLEAGEKAIYVFGGQCCIGGPYEYYNDVYRFNLETNHWEFIETYDGEPLNGKPQRPHPRSQSFIFVKNGYLYVYGGYDGHNIFADMYRLEISTRTWTLIWASKYSEGCGLSPVGVGGLRPVDFKIHPCRPAALIVKEKLLVLSEDYENITAILFSIDLKTFRWTRMASVKKTESRPTSLLSLGPPARGNPTMSFDKCSGQLLIIGGHNRNESRFPGLRQNHGQLGHVWAFRLPRKMDWSRERVLWIACLKNSPANGCYLACCPPHIIYHIITYVNSDTFS